MLTKDQVLEQLQQYNPVVKGSKIVIFTTEERTGLLKNLAERIPGGTYAPPTSSGMSTAGELRVGGIRVEAKRPKGSNASSGAGSYITDLAESGQCYYCAAAWYGSDFSVETLQKTSKHVNATASLNEVMTLPDDWIHSLIATAKALNASCGSKRYVFHRGSGFVNGINFNFQNINKVLREFSNVNKWSPADIWMVSKEYENTNFNFADFNQLNAFLLDAAKARDLVGVSLKKTGSSASVSQVNFGGKKYSIDYKGSSLGKRGYFDSKDVYIFYSEGEIQFRGFPTWQGEIKGKTANHGKISGGPINNIIGRFTRHRIDQQSTIDSKVRSKSKGFYKDFHDLYVHATKDRMKLDAFMQQIQNKDNNWMTSKYLGTQLIDIMNGVDSATQQRIVSSILNYAKSQSDFSAPFLKVQ